MHDVLVSTGNAAKRREVATEIVAIGLFNRAHTDGIVITRAWVDGQLERLRGHSMGCPCPEPCQLIALVTANQVHWTASTWQQQYGKARVLARR